MFGDRFHHVLTTEAKVLTGEKSYLDNFYDPEEDITISHGTTWPITNDRWYLLTDCQRETGGPPCEEVAPRAASERSPVVRTESPSHG